MTNITNPEYLINATVFQYFWDLGLKKPIFKNLDLSKPLLSTGTAKKKYSNIEWELMSERYNFKAGNYIIIFSTCEPGLLGKIKNSQFEVLGKFLLKMYSNQSIQTGIAY